MLRTFAPLIHAVKKKVYIESYGCQMNFSDSEIVASILAQEGYEATTQADEADLVLLNTCSIRDKAEQTVLNRIDGLKHLKREQARHEGGCAGLHGRADARGPVGKEEVGGPGGGP